MSLAVRKGSNLTLNLQEESLRLVANALPWYQSTVLAAPGAALGTLCSLYETFSRHSQAAEPSGNKDGGRQTVTALSGGTPPQYRAPGNGADLRGVKLSPHWLSTADRNAWTSFPGRLKTSTIASGGFAHSRFDKNEKGAHDESLTTA